MSNHIARSALSLSMVMFMLLSCSNAVPTGESNKVTSTTSHNNSKDNSNEKPSKTEQSKENRFKAELAFDVSSLENQLSEDQRPLLTVLEKNLKALVEHNHDEFQVGFVNKKLADALDFYYGENLQYKFTGVESVESNSTIKNQVHITVIGECLDNKTGKLDSVKMMYAIRQNEKGTWDIYTID
ncbi:hypothetical protein [Paenibacillus rhizoplanae]|uniref:Lipoprotein n=1 Tax=Paenibacillus rhizoplanae TaxID=1917181 RepID=A0ABW5F3S0_9BACL